MYLNGEGTGVVLCCLESCAGLMASNPREGTGGEDDAGRFGVGGNASDECWTMLREELNQL